MTTNRPSYTGKQQQAMGYLSRFQDLPEFQKRMHHTLGLLSTFYVPEAEVEEFRQYLIRECRNLIVQSMHALASQPGYKESTIDPTQVFIEVGQLEAGEAKPPFTPIQRAYLSTWAGAVSQKMFDISVHHSMPQLPRDVEQFLQSILNPSQPQETGLRFFDQVLKSLEDKLLLADVPKGVVDQHLELFRTARSRLRAGYSETVINSIESKRQEEIKVEGLTQPERNYMKELLDAEKSISESGTRNYRTRAKEQEDPISSFQRQMADLARRHKEDEPAQQA